jgi:hypothetical protein
VGMVVGGAVRVLAGHVLEQLSNRGGPRAGSAPRWAAQHRASGHTQFNVF